MYDTATKTKTVVEGDPDPTGISEMEDGKLKIENGVYDLQGRRMESSIFNHQSSRLKKGLFIMSVKQANGQTKNIKVLK